MRRALIFGSTGHIGRALAGRLAAAGVEIVGSARPGAADAPDPCPGSRPDSCSVPPSALPSALPLDLSDEEAVRNVPLPPADVAFFCAGVTSLKACAADPGASRRVNVQAPILLRRRLATQGTRLVYLSSSSVFDGSRPLRETDEPTCPMTEYGRQKAEAEAALLAPYAPLASGAPGASGGDVLVVRLTKVITPGDLFDQWRKDLLAGKTIRPFSDMPVAPVSLEAAAAVLAELAATGASGIRHVSAPRDISYAEAARRLAERLGVSPDLVRPQTVAESGIALEHAPRCASLGTRGIRGLTSYRLLQDDAETA